MVDVSQNHATSFIPFSSISVPFIMFIIAFTSFAFTMFYVSSVDVKIPSNDKSLDHDWTDTINEILWFIAMILCCAALITVLV
jgi:hypothetical protein